MLTIIIPTMNRSDFIIRQLNYYADFGYKHWISIGDSSGSAHLKVTKDAIKKLEGKLKINYYEYSGLDFIACFQKLNDSISTKYAVFTADDDFLIPSGLEKSIDFLEKYPDYIAAHGRGIMLSIDESGPYGNINAVWKYELPVLEAPTAAERLLKHLGYYTVSLFVVHQAAIWKRIVKNVFMPDRSFAGELLYSCLSAIYGKIAQVDGLYLVRHVHDRRYALPDMYDWITSPDWFTSYQAFFKYLVQELVKQDNIPEENAYQVVKQAFWAYLNTYLSEHYRGEYNSKDFSAEGKPFISGLRKNPSLVKYLRPAWRKFRYMRYKIFPSDSHMLPSLLSPRSADYDDFMPIYKIITNPQGV